MLMLLRQSVINNPSKIFSSDPDDHQPYERLNFSGFMNIGTPDGPVCDDILLPTQNLEVSPSIYLEHNVLDIAETIVHPMVDYAGQPTDMSYRQIVAKTWGTMAGSSVWLEKQGVYFSVSRVFFYTQGVKHWPKISFAYAQIYDSSWRQLHNYNISWQGETIVFPRILDIPAFYQVGGGFYGPEDPRIILEQGVEDAEPVVVFNMLHEKSERKMHVHRPFSNYTTLLRIDGEDAAMAEKNWSPFFMPRNTVEQRRWPSNHVHFIYNWSPLKILRCHLLNGHCSFVYKQDQPTVKWSSYTEAHKYNDTKGVMRGGTNFEPLNVSPGPGLTSFVGLPRTHTDAGCGKEAIYRPVLTVLTTNGTHFYLDYMSAALDFGHAILTHNQYNDVCEEGRILLANSIIKFDSRPNHDTLTVSFTVADSTVQVAKLRGITNLVENLPPFQLNGTAEWHNEVIQHSKLNVTHDVLVCAIQSVSDYALLYTNVTDREATVPLLQATASLNDLTFE